MSEDPELPYRPRSPTGRPTHAGRRTPLPRGRLSRERVVGCALDLIDEDGVDSLSMRRLGSRVGAEAMSLYRHVPNRAALLDEVVGAVLSKVELPGPDETDWEAALRRYARSFRAALLEHPNVFPLLATVGPEHPAVRRDLEAIGGLWARVGLDRRRALQAQGAMMGYLFGSVMWSTRGPTPPAGARRPSRALADSIFEFGLDALISGMRERLHPS